MKGDHLSRLCFGLFLLKLFMMVTLVSAKESPGEKVMGFSVTEGAAAGYIEDKACQQCHPAHWKTYQEVGMSHSFSEVKEKNFIENFDLPPYFHEPSQRYYHITRNNDDLTFKRYQLDHEGQPINVFQQQIDWILGSGNRTRSYLYQTEIGEIYQLPLGWYSQSQQWLMGPGFEEPHHFGVERMVRRECLFCHNAYPEVAKGSDQRWQPHVFPKKLPHGTGCQRCHGPGAEHVKTVISGGTLQDIKDKIINPAKLPPQKRDSVCFQCHLLPAVAMIGVRKFGRDDYSFRPGESITDYMVHVDIDSADAPKSERFEINHHAYRLRQSQCFIKSENKLTCISCHNPHKKVPAEKRVEHYGSVCLSCHKNDHPVIEDVQQLTKQSDCIACHMPERRTEDVIHVTMTDHKIQRHVPSKKQRLAPLKRRENTIDNVTLLLPEASVSGMVGEVYKAVAILRAVMTLDAIEFFENLLKNIKNVPPSVYLELANFQVKRGRYLLAQKSLDLVLKALPENTQALKLQGIVFQSQNKYKQSEALYHKALTLVPEDPELYFNLGLNHYAQKRYDLAFDSFTTAVSLRPNMKIAWYYLGELQRVKNKGILAIDYYKKALSIDPSFDRAYLKLSEVYLLNDQPQEAQRYLRHGVKVAKDNEPLIQALQKITVTD